MIVERKLPKVAPIKNKLVTSPPLNPDPKVIAVKSNFKRKTYQFIGVVKDCWIVSSPRPIYLKVAREKVYITIANPPKNDYSGRKDIFFAKKFLTFSTEKENEAPAKPKKIPAIPAKKIFLIVASGIKEIV